MFLFVSLYLCLFFVFLFVFAFVFVLFLFCFCFFAVVWNVYLSFFYQNFIFHFTRSHKSCANNQICCITKPLINSEIFTFVESLFNLKPFWWKFKNLILEIMRALFMFENYWLCLNIDYVVCFVLKSMNKSLLMPDASFAYLFSVVNNNIALIYIIKLFLINSAICGWHSFSNKGLFMGSNNRE